MAELHSHSEATPSFALISSPPSSSSPSSSSFSPFSSSYSESKRSLLNRQSRDPSPMGAGLVNLGNTCFVNAVLQCFTHTVPLVQSLRSSHHTTPCENEGFCVLCFLRDHIENSLSKSGGIVSPSHLVDNLNYLSSSFEAFQQEDAHEFLQCLLDSLHNCCLGSKSQEPSSSVQADSLVKQIFGGRLRSQLRCCSCGHCSNTFEPLNDLSLEVDDADTLENALKLFTKVEKIEDLEMKFRCDNCKEKVSVEKQLSLDMAPAVTMFHLKRFKSDGYNIEKIRKFVEYPLELDLQPFLSCSDGHYGNLKYNLYAAIVHIGSLSTSGHYFSFIRSSPDSWHKFDDSMVMEVSETTVLSQEAYILFYIRQDLPWFSSLREVQKKCSAYNSATTSPKSVLDDTEKMDVPLPAHAVNCSSSGSKVHETTCNMDRSPPKTPSNISTEDVFYSEPLDDEPSGELFHIPRGYSSSVVHNGMHSKIVATTAEDKLKAEGLKRLMKSMPSSRRSSLLACIPTSRGSLSQGSPNSSKRRRTVFSAGSTKSDNTAYSDGTTGVSYQSLNQRCLKAAAGQDDSQVLFQIDSQ